MVTPNIIVSIAGLPKSGKTHLSFSFEPPIKVFSFDTGADWIREKRFPDKDITIKNIQLPVVDDERMIWADPVWSEFYTEYKEDVLSGTYKTVTIDTGTTMEQMLRQAIFEWLKQLAESNDKNKQKLAVQEYSFRNLRMKAIYDLPKDAGVNLVVTHYLGERWVRRAGADRAEPTGELVLQGWNQTEGFADVNLRMESKMKGNTVVKYTTVESTRFDQTCVGQTYENTDYDELIAVLMGD